MKKNQRILTFISVSLFVLQIFSIRNGYAQQVQLVNTEEELRKDAINIFIDDQGLDMNFVREQIPYGNFVRDTRLADVYIRESRQSNGSGGSTYTYVFEGQNKFANMNDTLSFATSPDDTTDQIRTSRTNMLKMGLVRYVARTPLYSELQITSGTGSQRPKVEAVDKWNNWVFELRTSPRYSSQARRKEFSMSNSAEISKITPDIKVQISINQSNSTSKNKIPTGWYESQRNSFSVSNLTVFSISDHWSWGGRFGFSSSTVSNYDSRFYLTPSIEYNLFPYSESTHHQLRMMYGIAFSMTNYADTTIYLKTKENLAQQSLDIAYKVQEKWGSANFSVGASNYMHDFSKNRFEVGGSISYRIATGLSVNLSAEYAWIYDQLSLPKGNATVEQILLGLVQLPTTNSFSSNFGLSYTFGSMYNNVVNPRFGR